MKRIPLLLIAITALLSGCANGPAKKATLPITPTQFRASTETKTAQVAISVEDKRADNSLDAILELPADQQLTQALQAAIVQSKLLSENATSKDALDISVSMNKLEWFVPGYKAMIKKAFATSFLTGGLGGLAYGSTDTEVHGLCELTITVKWNGEALLTKTYSDAHIEKMAKLKCDSMQTKSRMAAISVSHVVDAFLPDLQQALEAKVAKL